MMFIIFVTLNFIIHNFVIELYPAVRLNFICHSLCIKNLLIIFVHKLYIIFYLLFFYFFHFIAKLIKIIYASSTHFQEYHKHYFWIIFDKIRMLMFEKCNFDIKTFINLWHHAEYQLPNPINIIFLKNEIIRFHDRYKEYIRCKFVRTQNNNE